MSYSNKRKNNLYPINSDRFFPLSNDQGQNYTISSRNTKNENLNEYPSNKFQSYNESEDFSYPYHKQYEYPNPQPNSRSINAYHQNVPRNMQYLPKDFAISRDGINLSFNDGFNKPLDKHDYNNIDDLNKSNNNNFNMSKIINEDMEFKAESRYIPVQSNPEVFYNILEHPNVDVDVDVDVDSSEDILKITAENATLPDLPDYDHLNNGNQSFISSLNNSRNSLLSLKMLKNEITPNFMEKSTKIELSKLIEVEHQPMIIKSILHRNNMKIQRK